MFKKTQASQQIELKTKTGQVRKFVKVKYLGSGGFARCYEVYEQLNQTRHPYAVKIIKKSTLLETKQLIQRLRTEIRLHKRFSSPQNPLSHIVRFIESFQTQDYIYLLLELCPNQTLNELIRRRKFLSQNETRYFVWQLAQGLKQLHDQNVIHRDVKLCNLFLGSGLRLKIGDFGLAAEIKENKRRFTVCGTANYVAPQMVRKDQQGKPIGHGYEVDVWALGVVCYTMFFGKYPFQAHQQQAIYEKVLKCKYSFSPYSMKEIKQLNINGLGHFPSVQLQSFIKQIFQTDPSKRLTLDEVLCHPFLTKTTIPEQLPEVTMKCMLKKQVSEKLFVENGRLKEIKMSQVQDRDGCREVAIEKTESFEDLGECKINSSRPVEYSDTFQSADLSTSSNLKHELPLDLCKQTLTPTNPNQNQKQSLNQLPNNLTHSNKFISNRRLFFKFLRNRSSRQQQATLSHCKTQPTPLLLQLILQNPSLNSSQKCLTKNGFLIKVYTYPVTVNAQQIPPALHQIKNLTIQYSIIIHPRLTYLTKVFSCQQGCRSPSQRVPLQLMVGQEQNNKLLTAKTLDSLHEVHENREKKQPKIRNKLIVKIPLNLTVINRKQQGHGNQNKERNSSFEEELNIVKLVYSYLRNINKGKFRSSQQLNNQTELSHFKQSTKTTSLHEIVQTQSTSLA